mgnify:FL=1
MPDIQGECPRKHGERESHDSIPTISSDIHTCVASIAILSNLSIQRCNNYMNESELYGFILSIGAIAALVATTIVVLLR